MAAYTTLDYLDDLTAAQMSAARVLNFGTAATNSVGWDSSASAYGVDSGALLHAVYRFNAIEGATYDIFSLSYFDPFLLRVFDALGNAIVANDEVDDPADVRLTDGGLYSYDALYNWRAPYTGTYYVHASWDQGGFYTFYSLDVYEDRDTAGGNRAPVVAAPMPDLNWTEGRLFQYAVPAGTFTDPDSNTLTYTARQSNGDALPAWLSFDPATRTFLGTAPLNAPDLQLRVYATDSGGLSAYDDLVFFTPAGSTGATITGTAGPDRLTGTSANETLIGLGGDDYLDGGPGNDILQGGDGNDVFDWDPAQRSGDDRFEGGAGNDAYVFSSSGDTVVEAPGGGIDTIWVTFDYSIAAVANLENLYGFAASGLRLTGNSLANSVSGTTGDDTLTGGGGNDLLFGKEGTDTAVFSGNYADYNVTFNAGAGTYTVTDRVAGRDGSDTLTAVELLGFRDGVRPASPAGFDSTAPTLLAADPADEATGVETTRNLSFTFSEPVRAGSGSIVLKTAAGAVVETYNPTSSANLAFSGATLVINPSADLAGGSGYRIEFAPGSVLDLAGNAYGGSSSYNFSTRASDDYAGSATTSGRVVVGQSRSGNLESSGDRDWFAVDLVAGSSYQFTLDGNSLGDPLLSLYSPGGTLLDSDDDSGTGLNSLLGFSATSSGTYFLSAGAYAGLTGSYTLAAALRAQDDYAANSATSGRLNLGGSASGHIETAGDEDWFAITLNAGQAVNFRLTGATLADPFLAVYTSLGVRLSSDDNGGGGRNAALNFTAPGSGTYFVAASGVGSQGTYSLTAQTLVEDDYSANPGRSGRVSPGGAPASGRIEVAGDHDWFAVDLAAGQSYQFSLDGATLSDPALALIAPSGQWVAADNDSGPGLNALVNYTAPSSGTYFIDASGQSGLTGSYSLAVRQLSTDDYAGNSGSAGRLSLGGSTTGNIEFAQDDDWFAVTLSAGQSVQFRLDGTGLADPVLRLLSAGGTLLAADDDGGGGRNSLISYTAPSSGTYFLSATGYGSGVGSYRLSASGGAADDYSGDTGTRGRVNIGGNITGVIESANDNDWFAVTLAAGQSYRFTLAATGQADPVLNLFGNNGVLLGSDDDSGGGLNALLNFTPTASGTYYLGARMQAGGTGAYTLGAQAQTATQGNFGIRVVYSGDSHYQSFFDQAAARWAQVITGDLPDVTDAQYGLIDDLLVVASVQAIDGAGGILGQAGFTGRRGAADGGLPYRGLMQFDSADLAAMEARGTLTSVVLHEMGHVLGLTGNFWQLLGLSNGASYTGANAVAAYRQLTGNLSLSAVPLETGGGAGTALSHWSENVFDTELMTGYAESVPPMPLSILTLGGLADLGYQVDYGAADPYTLP